MKIADIGCGRVLWIGSMLSAAFTSGLPLQAQASRDSSIAGKWELSTQANRAEKRVVILNKRNGQLGGFYTRKDGRQEPITQARYDKKALSFRVPTVRLQFRNIKLVKGHLVGELIDGNPGEMSNIPQAVRLVRLPD